MLTRAPLAALLWLCLAGVAWSQQNPPIQAPRTEHAQAPASEQRGTDKDPLTVKILPTGNSKEQADKIERERHEKAEIDKRLADDTNRLANDTDRLANETQNLVEYTRLLAVFTGALFSAAIFQVGLFWVQLRYMRDAAIDTREAAQAALVSAQTAREEFNATHRPKVFVRGFQTLEAVGQNDDASVTFLSVNGGIGPATIIEIWTALIVAKNIRSAPTFKLQKIPGLVLVSGDKEIFEIEPHDGRFNFGRGFNEGDPAKTSQVPAYAVGRIVYEDSKGRRRETGFCRKNEPGTDRWVMVENSEYEYQD
jgi:hypothetical protein